MRILQVIHSLRRGGAERVVLDLATGLAKRGHTVRICTLSSVNEFKSELELCAGEGIHSHSILPDTKFRFLPNIPILVLRLKRIIQKMKPDLLHCHLRTDAAVCSLVRNICIVRTIHISRPLIRYSKTSLFFLPINWLERRSLTLSKVRIVTCSKAAGQSISPYLAKFNRPMPTVIENGSDLSRIKEAERYDQKRNSYIIILTGTLLNIHKNQQMGIRALRELLNRDIDCHLWLLGDGPDRANLERLAAQLNLMNRVKFFGEVKNVEEHLARASIYWLTSRFEGMPIVLLEAMAARLPIVATAVAGVEEVLAPWPELLVRVDDYVGMAEVTAGLIRCSERRKEIGTALRRRAFEKYSADRMVEEYMQFYRKCLM